MMMEGGSHTELEYIEFVDMAYIDTGYIPGDNTAFEGTFDNYGETDSVALVVLKDTEAYTVTVDGAPCHCNERFPGMFETPLPKSKKNIQVKISLCNPQ